MDSGDAPPLPPRAAHLRAISTLPSLNSGSIRRLADVSDPANTNAYHGEEQGTSAMTTTTTTTTTGGGQLVIDPLLQSMIELEAGLADGSILTQFEVSLVVYKTDSGQSDSVSLIPKRSKVTPSLRVVRVIV